MAVPIARRQVARRPVAGRPITTRSASGGGQQTGTGGGGTTFPVQAETTAYLAGCGLVSATFSNAVNSLIYRLKAIGYWNNIVGGYLMCGETEAGVLQNIRRDKAAFDGVKVGTVPFLPKRGYGPPFTAANSIQFQIPAANLGFSHEIIVGGMLDLDAINTTFYQGPILSDVNSNSDYGHLYTFGGATGAVTTFGSSGNNITLVTPERPPTGLMPLLFGRCKETGSGSGAVCYAGSWNGMPAGGSAPSFSSPPGGTRTASCGTTLGQFSVYFCGVPGATGFRQMTQAVNAVSSFLHDVGAF